MAKVTIIINGKPTQVEETRPGLFGELGYQYANQPTPSPQPAYTPPTPPQQPYTPPKDNSAEIARLKAEAEKLQKQVTEAQNFGYSGNQQIEYAPSGQILPAVQPTGNAQVDAMFKQMQDLIAKMYANGGSVNPQLDLSDPAVMKQFYDQAEKELGPYYQNLFKAAKSDLYSYLDTSKKEYELQKAKTMDEFRNSLGTQRESAAGAGTIFSSNRSLGEKALADTTSRSMESLYNKTAYDVGGQIRDYTQKYGTDTGATFQLPKYAASPLGSGSLTPELTQTLTPEAGVTGSEEFKARAAKDVYAKQLGQWKNQYLNINH